jgi:hypothetical protein
MYKLNNLELDKKKDIFINFENKNVSTGNEKKLEIFDEDQNLKKKEGKSEEKDENKDITDEKIKKIISELNIEKEIEYYEWYLINIDKKIKFSKLVFYFKSNDCFKIASFINNTTENKGNYFIFHF